MPPPVPYFEFVRSMHKNARYTFTRRLDSLCSCAAVVRPAALSTAHFVSGSIARLEHGIEEVSQNFHAAPRQLLKNHGLISQ